MERSALSVRADWADKNKVDVQLDFLTAIGNKIIAREPLMYDGEVFRLERGFTIRFRPPRQPVYVINPPA